MTKKTHQTFEPTLNNEERINKRGPRAKGFLEKCKNRIKHATNEGMGF